MKDANHKYLRFGIAGAPEWRRQALALSKEGVALVPSTSSEATELPECGFNSGGVADHKPERGADLHPNPQKSSSDGKCNQIVHSRRTQQSGEASNGRKMTSWVQAKTQQENSNGNRRFSASAKNDGGKKTASTLPDPRGKKMPNLDFYFVWGARIIALNLRWSLATATPPLKNSAL